MAEPIVPLAVAVKIGDRVCLRTSEDDVDFVVVRYGRWWRKGLILIRHLEARPAVRPERTRWVHPCEVKPYPTP